MAFDNNRQMFDVNLNCAECDKKITQLPFEPSNDKAIYCSDCLRARRSNRGDRGGNGGFQRRERRMYDVNITCGDCNKQITQLPFQPSGDRPVYCFECNSARRER